MFLKPCSSDQRVDVRYSVLAHPKTSRHVDAVTRIMINLGILQTDEKIFDMEQWHGSNYCVCKHDLY